MSRGNTSRRARAFVAAFGIGFATIIAANIFVTLTWSRWVTSLGPGYRLAIAAGQIDAFAFAAPAATKLTLLALGLAAVLAGWYGNSVRRSAVVMWSGAMTATIICWSRVRDFPGNLWPISVVMFCAFLAVPVVLGVLAGDALRDRTRGVRHK